MPAQTLTTIYEAQPAARKLFDWILHAGVEDGRTTVEGLMESCEVTRRQAITVLRSLADAGHGEFKVGRKGHPSRLEWAEDPRALAHRLTVAEPLANNDAHEARAPVSESVDEVDALDEPSPQSTPTPTPTPTPKRGEPGSSAALFPDMFVSDERPQAKRRPSTARKSELIQHSYVLRPKLRIVVDLPEDLSAREAEILGEWLRNLSFER